MYYFTAIFHFSQNVLITCDNYLEYFLYVFVIRHFQKFSSFQPVEVRFDLRPAAPAATALNGFAFLSTNVLMSISSDGQRPFDSIYVLLFQKFYTLFHCQICFS